MRSPSGGEARHRGGTQVGKAPPSPEMVISGLTESGLSGRMMTPINSFPRLCRTLRPAPQAGCFVSGLKLSKDSAQITSRHRAFRTAAIAPSSTPSNPSAQLAVFVETSGIHFRDPPLADPRALGAAAAAPEMCQLRLGASRL